MGKLTLAEEALAAMKKMAKMGASDEARFAAKKAASVAELAGKDATVAGMKPALQNLEKVETAKDMILNNKQLKGLYDNANTDGKKKMEEYISQKFSVPVMGAGMAATAQPGIGDPYKELGQNIKSGYNWYKENVQQPIADTIIQQTDPSQKLIKEGKTEQAPGLQEAGRAIFDPANLGGGAVGAAQVGLEMLPESDNTQKEAQPMSAEGTNMQKPKMYAEGGDVTNDQPAVDLTAITDPVMSADTSGAVEKPSIDPMTSAARDNYNKLVSMSSSAMGGKPDESMMFGGDKEPANFNPKLWQTAQGMAQQSAHAAVSTNADEFQKLQTENAARQQAGLSPLPVPQSLIDANNAAQQIQAVTQPQQVAGPVPSVMQQPNPMLDVYNKEGQALMGGLEQQRAGIMGQANAEAALGQKQAEIQQKAMDGLQQTQNDYNSHFEALNNERQQMLEDIKAGHIDPNRMFHNMGAVGQIGTMIGLILGGIGAGLTGQKNQAMEFLNSQIDRDITAQRADLGKKENLLHANMQAMGNLRDATAVTKAMQLDTLSHQLQKAAAESADPMAKARAQQAIGQLNQQSASLIGQVSMRQAILGNSQNGNIPPAYAVRALVPEKEQPAAYKELQEAQNMAKGRDNLISAYDQISKINTVGNKVMNPIQSGRQVDAIWNPLLAQLSKDSAGRFTEADAHMLDTLKPSVGDTAASAKIKRQRLMEFVSSKMNFPVLDAYNIKVGGRFGANGRNKIQESPVPVK